MGHKTPTETNDSLKFETLFLQAEQFHTKILDEDGVLDLIRTRPGKKSKYTIQAEESVKKV